MIAITKSSTADNRTCDKTQVAKGTLLKSSMQHIEDVGKAIAFFQSLLTNAAVRHDYDKLTAIDWFHEDFRTDILKAGGWLENHYQIHRHHIDKEGGCPSDVTLIDVLEHIADCVMAGMGRAGKVFPISLSDDLLQRAVVNTVALLQQEIVVTDDELAS